MKKYLIILLLLLFSCEKDFIEDVELSVPREDMIFKVSESSVVDGQTIFFETTSESNHTLVIFDSETQSTVSKQSFTSKIGLNDITLYTKILPKKTLQLILYQGSIEYKKTNIIVQ